MKLLGATTSSGRERHRTATAVTLMVTFLATTVAPQSIAEMAAQRLAETASQSGSLLISLPSRVMNAAQLGRQIVPLASQRVISTARGALQGTAQIFNLGRERAQNRAPFAESLPESRHSLIPRDEERDDGFDILFRTGEIPTSKRHKVKDTDTKKITEAEEPLIIAPEETVTATAVKQEISVPSQNDAVVGN